MMRLKLIGVAFATLLALPAIANECVRRCENACLNGDRECPVSRLGGASPTRLCLSSCGFERAGYCESACYSAPLDRRGRTICMQSCRNGVVLEYFLSPENRLYVMNP